MARYDTGNLVKVERQFEGVTVKGSARYDIDLDAWTCTVRCGDYIDVRAGITDVFLEFADMVPLALDEGKRRSCQQRQTA